jgi:hypothetical protein
MFRFKVGTLRLDPARGLERYLARRPRTRTLALAASAATILAGVFLFAVRPMLAQSWETTAFSLSTVLALGGVAVFSIALRSHEIADWMELKDVRRKSEQLQDKMGEQPDVFGIVQLSLSQLTEYYTINKGQARKSFNFSVFAIAVGLATIIGGVWLLYSGRLSAGVGIVSAVSGLLLQFFGGANFYIYNKSLVQMNYFYDRLMQMQDAMLSIKVGDQIQDAELKDKVKEYIVSQLLLKSHSKVSPSLQPKPKLAAQPKAAGHKKAAATAGTGTV